ncbi:tetratricopeptide repeat protein [Fictibacillus phosphorivorans]|uniref:tetratricopeptide repeat protein n=1 Tax=Fictibacillus phosphorivorans TaxID=1221500 RepID=UPI001293BD64|nr:tetratricopeptide repeat protein [Fictibacillus phosphorivorans]MQR94672.1 tetratricopeptide repeat protein [Fictibacillus phosphorivorans]
MFPINTNKEAIEQLEENNVDQAMKLFHKAVLEKRDVQSLTNLAWVIWREEDDLERALSLASEAVDLRPTSHFPYSLCGELLLENKRYEDALNMLQQAISIEPTNITHHNLGVAYYYLGETAKAATHFGLAAGKSDYTLYNQVKCLIELGEKGEALRLTQTFDEDAEDFIGTIDLAELYAEIGLHEEAVHWFEKGWKDYYLQPEWVGLYIYSLLQSKQETKANNTVKEFLRYKKEEILETKTEELDEDWTEEDKKEVIIRLTKEINDFEILLKKIKDGYLPAILLEPSSERDCYLFGCERHQHPEYKDS